VSGGEPGQPGGIGAPGLDNSFVAACGGGAGGGGAGGGGGGGGSGGPSAGIAWTGAVLPTVDGAMVMTNVGNPSTFRPGASSIEGAGASGGAHGDPTQAPSLPGGAGRPGYSVPTLGL
jgi:endoglucanase